MLIASGLAIVVTASIVIMYACNSFEDASDYLGRNMPAGVKGATINAIASSMPELFTTTFLLFMFHDMDGFSAGIATCAGSAVFNAVIIPSLCIIAVLFFSKEKVKFITISKSTVLRDGLFFVTAELILIYFLSGTKMMWWMGGLLLLVYLTYFSYLMYQMRNGKSDEENEENQDEEDEISLFTALRTLDFNQLFFKGKDFNTSRAWIILIISTSVIGGACYFLAEATMQLAEGFNIPPFVAAVIFAAAATSVPDTVISVKDALKGNYDDAVSNAVGSNIFDITVCLGLPLLAYGLIYGDVTLSVGQWRGANVQELRIGLVIVTVSVLSLMLIGKKLGKLKAVTLFSIYFLWLLFVLGFNN